jgi:hypothetical protein
MATSQKAGVKLKGAILSHDGKRLTLPDGEHYGVEILPNGPDTIKAVRLHKTMPDKDCPFGHYDCEKDRGNLYSCECHDFICRRAYYRGTDPAGCQCKHISSLICVGLI